MFKSSVSRLTAWYMLIIVMISLFFSSFIYLSSPREVRSGLPRYGFYGQASNPSPIPPPDVSDLRNRAVSTIRHRLLDDLIEFNLMILLISGAASYWLARQTLRPIEEALDAQSRFTADASHELRTPLTAMRSEIEVAFRDPRLSKAQAIDLLRSNLEEVAKLEALSAGLLQLAQRDANGLPLEDVSLQAVITSAVSRQQKVAAASKIKIETKDTDVTVRGHADALIELFSILLNNAIKYSQEGGTVRVTTQVGAGVKVAVRDEGVGIKAMDLPHIFSRFYRADTSRSKRDATGYGLGLSIAQKIVHSVGGSIDVTSTPGKGSIFTVSLKRAENLSKN